MARLLESFRNKKGRWSVDDAVTWVKGISDEQKSPMATRYIIVLPKSEMVSKWSFETSFFVVISNLTLIASPLHGSVSKTKMASEWPFETLVLLKPPGLSDFLSTQQQDFFGGSSHLEDGVDAPERESEVF